MMNLLTTQTKNTSDVSSTKDHPPKKNKICLKTAIKFAPLIIFIIMLSCVLYFTGETNKVLMKGTDFIPMDRTFFLHFLWVLPAMIITRLILDGLFQKISFVFMSKRYFTKNGNELTEEGQKCIPRISLNLYKVVWFILSTYAAFVAVQNAGHPADVLWNFNIDSMFKEGQFPNVYFKTESLFYHITYMSHLTYYIIDFFYLIYINEKSPDFVSLIIHHVVTIYLALLSYFGGATHCFIIGLYDLGIGSLVNNVFRITLYMDPNTLIKAGQMFIMALVFLYTRVIVFGYVGYDICARSSKYWITDHLFFFNVILYMLQIYWVYQMFMKSYVLFKTWIKENATH